MLLEVGTIGGGGGECVNNEARSFSQSDGCDVAAAVAAAAATANGDDNGSGVDRGAVHQRFKDIEIEPSCISCVCA